MIRSCVHLSALVTLGSVSHTTRSRWPGLSPMDRYRPPMAQAAARWIMSRLRSTSVSRTAKNTRTCRLSRTLRVTLAPSPLARAMAVVS